MWQLMRCWPLESQFCWTQPQTSSVAELPKANSSSGETTRIQFVCSRSMPMSLVYAVCCRSMLPFQMLKHQLDIARWAIISCWQFTLKTSEVEAYSWLQPSRDYSLPRSSHRSHLAQHHVGSDSSVLADSKDKMICQTLALLPNAVSKVMFLMFPLCLNRSLWSLFTIAAVWGLCTADLHVHPI